MSTHNSGPVRGRRGRCPGPCRRQGGVRGTRFGEPGPRRGTLPLASRAVTACAGRAGPASVRPARHGAATPVTCGDAIDVPEYADFAEPSARGAEVTRNRGRTGPGRCRGGRCGGVAGEGRAGVPPAGGARRDGPPHPREGEKSGRKCLVAGRGGFGTAVEDRALGGADARPDLLGDVRSCRRRSACSPLRRHRATASDGAGLTRRASCSRPRRGLASPSSTRADRRVGRSATGQPLVRPEALQDGPGVRNRPFRPGWGEGDTSTVRARRSRSRPRRGRVATTVDRNTTAERGDTVEDHTIHTGTNLQNGNNAHRVRQRTDKVEP